MNLNFIRAYFLVLKKYSLILQGGFFLDLILKFLSKQFLTKYFFIKDYSLINSTFITYLGSKIANSRLILDKFLLRCLGCTSEVKFFRREVQLGPYNKYITFVFTIINYLVKNLNLIYNINFKIFSNYKYNLLSINMIYIICIVINWSIDCTLTSYLFPKFSNIFILQYINKIISNLIIIENYIYNLEITSYINITLYNITYINYIFIFIVIYIIFSYLIFFYLFIIIKIKPLFDSLIIKILLRQLNFIKSIKILFILILNFINLGLLGIEEYYLSIHFNNSNLKNMISFSLVNNELELDPNASNTDQSITSPSGGFLAPPSEEIKGGLESEGEEELVSKEDILFNKFYELSGEDRKRYIINKYDSKGMIATFYSISWLMEKINLDTDGTKHNVDIIIDKYLNQILNLERDTQLKSFAFHREKPFLRHLIFNTPLEYPYVIPAKINMTESDMYDLKDALIKNEEETVNQD